jgi:hypothetical protein
MQLTALPSPQCPSPNFESHYEDDNASLYENDIQNQEFFWLFYHFLEKMVVFNLALALEAYSAKKEKSDFSHLIRRRKI